MATPCPRFSWALCANGRAARQTAYEIIVGDTFDDVAAGTGSHWQTGRIASDQQLDIRYEGKPLASNEDLCWSVRVWDEQGLPSVWAEPQRIRTGLMSRSDWCANWIARYFVLPAGREAPTDTIYDNRWQARPADYLRRDFKAKTRPVRATLYITALGLYRAFINGERIGDDVMAPGWTDYHQRVIYQSFDVTDLVSNGANALGVVLGEGWYSGRVGHNQKRAGNHYGGRPALFCQLQLHFADGSVETIASDESWKTAQGPICYSDFLVGELYDARLERPGWDRAGFDDSTWQPVEVFVPEPREPVLTADKCPPVREKTRLAGKRVGQSRSGGWIYDFGQNIAGYVELVLTAEAGSRFMLRHAERLDTDGELYTANLRHAVSIDHYIARGEGMEVFKPHFTFHGFQYAELTLPEGVAPDSVKATAIAIWSDLTETGSIETGNALVNQLVSNIMWSQRDNFLSVPTDCPQRDERLGWSADAQVFWRTAGFNMDVAGFFAKWCDDILDAQLPNGAFTDIAPSRPLNPYRQSAQPGAPGWGDAPVILCWQHYLRYADRDLLAAAYPALQRWMRHIAEANPDFVRVNAVYNNYGDWLNVGPASDRTMVATAYWAHVADLMAKIADVLGQTEDQRAYAQTGVAIRQVFNARFVDADARILSDTQTAYLLALDFDLLPEALRSRALAHLVEKLDAADGHLQTGFLGVKHLCRVLADNGRADYAFRLLLNDTYPSWGFSIRQGATTIWERWDGWTEERGFQSANMNSFNHYAYGSVGEWLYARLAGIDWDEARPGFRAIRLRPLFDARIGHVAARYQAPTGTIESRWQVNDGTVEWSFVLPPNCDGTVELPFPPSAIRLDGQPVAGASDVAHTRFPISPGTHSCRIAVAAADHEKITE